MQISNNISQIQESDGEQPGDTEGAGSRTERRFKGA